MNGRKPKEGAVRIVTLGCAKNEVDSEEIAGVLRRDGYSIDGEAPRPEIVIINTCGFLEAAKRESMTAIKQAVAEKKKGRVRKVIVAGCLAQRMGADLAGELPGVDAVTGVGQMARFGELVRDTQQTRDRVIEIGPPHHMWADVGTRARSGNPWSAYLKISEGCDHSCSFCAIPSFRGRHASKPKDRILAEARDLIERGAKELNLIAQDSTQYGHDLYGRLMLPDLLRSLDELDGVHWIRPLYCYPSRINDAMIESLATLPRVCRYIDIPLQHAHRDVLKAMQRPGDAESYLRMIGKLRTASSEFAIRTTFIVGFPGETDAQFAALLDFVKEARFDRVGAFEYSSEKGTPSAEMPDHVSSGVKRERFDALMTLQQRISLEKNREWIGRKLEALVEGVDPRIAGASVGRTFRDAPEIDGQVYVKNCAAAPGSFVRATVKQAAVYDLFAEAVSE